MDNDKSFPKTLVLCQNKINQYTGGGVILANFFGEVPPDRLIFFHRDVDYPANSPFVEKRLDWLWLRINFYNFFEILFRWIFANLFSFKNSSIKDFKSILIQSCYFYFPKEVDQQVREFKPEVLYAWCSDILWAETIKSVAKRYKIPYVIHFMDNHVDLNLKSTFEIATFPVFKRKLGKLVDKSDILFAISNAMGQSYKKRWGKQFEEYHGVIETSKWPLTKARPIDKDNFKIAYTGSIEQGQLLGLKDVVAALEKLTESGINIKLFIYVTPSYAESVKSSLGKSKCVKIKNHPNFSSLRKELLKADLLLLAFGFDKQTINYYRYSFATKIVPYMLSGRPILVYGPEEIEPVKYAVENGWALVVSHRSEDLVLNAIYKLIGNNGMRESLAKKAWEKGAMEHDLSLNAKRFKLSMTNIAKKNI